MLVAVRQALEGQGAIVTQLQLLRIDFPDQYESMITAIQLQVQAKATKEYVRHTTHMHKAMKFINLPSPHKIRYEQKVLTTLNDLSVLVARNGAEVSVVAANAEREAQTLRNEARTKGMLLIQVSTGVYRFLRTHQMTNASFEKGARATATRLVADALSLDPAETVQYLKVQSIKAHPASRTVLGLGDPFSDGGASGGNPSGLNSAAPLNAGADIGARHR